MGGCGGLERTDFNSFYFVRVWWIKIIDFYQFLLWEGVVVMKELIFNSFYFGKCAVVLKELIFNSFYLGGCGGLERTDF